MLKRDFSAGGVVFKKEEGKTKILLIRNYKKDKDVNYWGFPKGHLDPGETSKDAAVREVEEETGIKAKILEKVDSSKYFYFWEGEKTLKTVAIFLMEYESGQLNAQQSEVAEAVWFSPEEALETVTFENEKKILQKALDKING